MHKLSHKGIKDFEDTQRLFRAYLNPNNLKNEVFFNGG